MTSNEITAPENNVCACCTLRVKNWKGEDPQCGFTSGMFDAKHNWMCALVQDIRKLCLREDHPQISHFSNEGQHYATISTMGLDILTEEDVEGYLNPQPVCLWVGWYKYRGRTEAMWLMFENLPPRAPTEEECLAILTHYSI